MSATNTGIGKSLKRRRAWPIALIAAAVAASAPCARPGDAVGRGGTGLAPDFTVSESFSSQLPLLIIDPASDGETAEIRIIDNPGGGPNHPGGEASLRTRARLTPGGLSPRPERKIRRTLELLTEGGEKNRLSLLGMPESEVWTLNGSGQDKSMLHNYLGLALAERMRPGRVPRARYCEVLHRAGREYVHQGLFLISEYIADGVWMAPRALTGEAYAAKLAAPGDGPAAGRGETFTVVYPSPKSDPARAVAIGAELADLGAMIASGTRHVFMRYASLLAVDDFIDAYILNEIMLNHDSDAPFYWYKRNSDDRIGVSVLWDFDQALDNGAEPAPELAVERISYPWFARLSLSVEFLESLKARFYRLRRSALNPASVDALVDDTAAFLGPALGRDWERWRQVYAEMAAQPLETAYGEALNRDTASVEQELLKIKHHLRVQDGWLRENIMRLQWQDGLFAPGLGGRDTLIYLFLFLFAFFALTSYARRRM